MRIQNLISLVNEQSQRTKAVEKDEIEEIQDLDSDDPFIRQAIELIEQNISTPGYTVEQLSRDLCMERTGLYKKISSLLDKSPSAFIKSIRLNRAVELIKTTDLTITEIAESTGFYSASHLGRSIQSQYGCKPTDLRKQTGH